MLRIVFLMTLFAFTEAKAASFVKEISCKKEKICTSHPIEIKLNLDDGSAFGAIEIVGNNRSLRPYPVSTITIEIHENEVICNVDYLLTYEKEQEKSGIRMSFIFSGSDIKKEVKSDPNSFDMFKKVADEKLSLISINDINISCRRGKIKTLTSENFCAVVFGPNQDLFFSPEEVRDINFFFESLDSERKPKDTCNELNYLSYKTLQNKEHVFHPDRWLPYLLPKFKELENIASFNWGEDADFSFLSKMKKIKKISLYYYNKKDEDYSFLLNIPSLESLDLGYSNFNDLALLRNMNKLKALYVDGTNVSSLATLERNDQLEKLDISYTKVLDLSVIEKLKNLKELEVSGLSISTENFLRNLEQLEYLDISSTLSRNLDFLRKFKKIKKINFSSVKIEDYSFLKEMPSLEIIRATNLPIENLNVFENNRNITYLDVSNTKILNIDNYTILPKLESLNVSSTELKDISMIGQNDRLIEINIENTKVEDFSPLFTNKNRKYYFLARTSFKDLSQFRNLSFTCLDISKTEIQELSGLENADFSYLDMRGINVTDLSPLEKIANLKMISVTNDQYMKFLPTRSPLLKKMIVYVNEDRYSLCNDY